MAAKKAKAKSVNAAQSRSEAEQLLGEIGQLQRQITSLEADMNEKLSTVKEKFEAEAAPLNEAIEEKFEALQTWAESNREDLCKDGGKTARLSTGELVWRVSPPAVRVTGSAAVLDALKSRGLDRFIRSKEEVNKEAILNERDTLPRIPGVEIVQTEEFSAKPFESEIERTKTSKRSAA
jgi:phage host-nuclease inhibitor protein Gam